MTYKETSPRQTRKYGLPEAWGTMPCRPLNGSHAYIVNCTPCSAPPASPCNSISYRPNDPCSSGPFCTASFCFSRCVWQPALFYDSKKIFFLLHPLKLFRAICLTGGSMLQKTSGCTKGMRGPYQGVLPAGISRRAEIFFICIACAAAVKTAPSFPLKLPSRQKPAFKQQYPFPRSFPPDRSPLFATLLRLKQKLCTQYLRRYSRWFPNLKRPPAVPKVQKKF